jgi:hypothetical protein
MPVFLRRALPSITLVLAVGTFLSILGPYDTHDLGLRWVWFYWTGLMAVGWAAGALAGAVFERWTPPWPLWTIYFAVSIIVSIPVTAAVVTIQGLVGPAMPLSAIPVVFLLVWVISAAVTAISWLRRPQKEAETAAPAIGRALLDKLPHKLRRAPLIALVSEDHYLRVYTEAGEAMILMRLGDALAAVETLDGAQTHRSWWVAREAVDKVSRGDGRAVLTLTNGVEAPVSRTYSKALREAGWY